MFKKGSYKSTGTPIDTTDVFLQTKSDGCLSDGNDLYAVRSQCNTPVTVASTSSFMNCVGLGMPFLTFHFQVQQQFLSRYKLKLGCVYTQSSTDKNILIDAIKEYGSQLNDCPMVAGGVSFDVARLIQWMLPQPRSVVFLGSKASDKDAATLLEILKKSMVGIQVEEVEQSTTSVQAIFHIKKRWCEVYFSDEGPTISTIYIDKPVVTKVLERANIIFTSDLSILQMPKVSKLLAYFSFSRFKHFVLIIHNLACLDEGKLQLFAILRYVDMLFLTPESADKFMEVFEVPQEKKQSCCRKSRSAVNIYLFMKNIASKSCTVIVSDGLRKAYIHSDLCDDTSSKYHSRYIKSCKVVDTYGTSRAFVAAVIRSHRSFADKLYEKWRVSTYLVLSFSSILIHIVKSIAHSYGFMAMMIVGLQVDPCVECGFFYGSLIASKFGIVLPEEREAILTKWYLQLDAILLSKCTEFELTKSGSSMPFTVFHTPWKELEVNAVCADKYEENASE